MNNNKKFPRYVGLYDGSLFGEGIVYVEFLSETHARGVMPDLTHRFDRKDYYPYDRFVGGVRVEITQLEAVQRVAKANGITA